MHRSSLSESIILAMVAMLLASCAGPPSLAPRPTDTPPAPTATQCIPSVVDSFPNTLESTDLLIELAWVPSGIAPFFSCDLFPTSTLLADGSAYYIDWHQPQTMVVHLAPDEAKALLQRVLDLGFECLGSWSSDCGPGMLDDGSQVEELCIYDFGESILQVRLPDGRLKRIVNYGGLANDPKALEAILTLLSDYQHPEAQPYVPDRACLCFIPWLVDGDNTAVDWPQDKPWLTASDAKSQCQLSVDGSDLETLLTVTGRNRGRFKIRAGELVYGIRLVSWPRGIDCETASPCPSSMGCDSKVCLPAEAPSSP